MDWEEKRYRTRMGIAGAVSLAAHLAAAVAWVGAAPTVGTGPEPEPAPITLNLSPETSLPAQSLVETVTPAAAPDSETFNIARQSTRAADMMLQEGDLPGPAFFEEAPAESLAQPTPAPQSVPSPTPPAPKETPREPEETQPEEESPEPPPAPERPALPADPPRQETPEDRPEQQPVKMAQAAAAPPQEQSPSKARGRLRNRVTNQGFTSFEAIQHEVAPYLEEVKKRVERQWTTALMKYNGTQARSVEVDCEIAADGSLALVEVVAPVGDVIYETLCAEAIRSAGPFDPFPFEVPEIYQNQNLEIRWRFSFL